jgi:hypothetical protein
MINLSRYSYHSNWESIDDAYVNIKRLWLSYYRNVDYLIVVENYHTEIWIADKQNERINYNDK